MRRLLLALACVAVVATSVAGAQNAFPTRIDLPDGFQPEGIATAGEQFYVGSIPTGAVYRGSLRTGAGSVSSSRSGARGDRPEGRPRPAVRGGRGYRQRVRLRRENGSAAQDVRAPDGRQFHQRRRRDQARSLVHGLVQGRSLSRAARAGGRPGAAAAATVSLTGDYVQGTGFNVNGIDATPNGKTLVIVQSGTGKLFAVTPSGVARTIALAGGESVPNGDGILLDGKTLYVVQNQLNMVAKIKLAPNLRTGRVVTRITNAQLPATAQFSVPTTIAELGSRLYAVNARFGTPPTGADYWITQFRK